jgi:class 3 adenylate cyclase/tetratricopeptide (TPR) repeat protein
MPGCPSCGADMPEGFAFCGRCGAPLPSAPDLEERRVVTVLFCDLAGFTARSDRADPEDVRALLRPYHARLRYEIERFGGTLDKFIGDGVMAVFGTPVAHEDDPERAVRCGLAIQQAVADLNQAQVDLALKVRVGITTGEAVIAADRHQSETVVGDVVNTASRLEGVAPVGGVVVGEPTFRATRPIFDYQALVPVRVKGKAEPLSVWRAISARSRLGVVSDQGPVTPFLGRAPELEQLQASFMRTRDEASVQLVTIVGEPGVGKSRLVREFHAFVDSQPDLITWRQSHCLPYGEGISFWALGEIFKAHAGILEFDTPSAAAAKVADAVAAVIDDHAEHQWLVARLAPLLGLAGAMGTTRGTPEREEAFTAWRRFLEAAAARRPLVVVLEDLHWADDAMLAFIQHLVEDSSDVPLLVVGTARLELYDQAPDWGRLAGRATTIRLAPLSDGDTARLLGSLLGQAVLAAELQVSLLEQVGGNPLYAEQVCRMLEERGLLERDGGVRHLRPDALAGMPDSIQALIAARLDTLSPERRALLQNAAVIGTVFWSGALLAASGRDPSVIQADLEDLATRAFIRPAPDSSVAGQMQYAFWHPLTREVAYGQLPRRARIHKHRAVAQWIERVAGERVTDHAELLTYHYLTALELARTVRAADEITRLQEPARRALVLAGDRAMDLDVTRADSHYQRALEMHSPDDPQRAMVLAKAAQTAVQLGSLQDAERQYREAISRFRTQGDALQAGDALSGLADVLWQRGLPTDARQTLRAAIQLLEREIPGPELASAYVQMALLSLISGRPNYALEWVGKIMVLADRLGADDIRQKALQMRGPARFDVGDLGGLDDLREAVELCLRLGLGRETARAYINLSELLSRQEGPAAALEANQLGRRVCEERGITDLALVCDVEIAECLANLGHWSRALRAVDEFLGHIEAEASSYFVVLGQAAKAFILVWRGDLEQAALLVDEFLPRASPIGDLQVLARVFPVAGIVKQAEGDVDAAIQCVKDFAAATRHAPASYRAQPLPDLVRICVAAGELELAEQLVSDVEVHPARAQHALLTAQAALAEAKGEFKEASKLYAEAVERWSRFGIVFEHGQTLLGLGRCLTRLAQPQAHKPLMEATAIFAGLRARPLMAETHTWLRQSTAQSS